MSAPSEIDFDRVRGGVDDLLRVVPRVPAVYAWFRKHFPPDPDSSSADDFAAYLESLVAQPHMLPRDARLAPVFRVSLSSDRRFSDGKLVDLQAVCSSSSFRREVAVLLREHVTTLSQPLYVGRATCLRDRVEDHLSGASGVRQRLEEAGIDMLRCRLTYIDLTDFADAGDDADAVPEVIEELLSKLFCPPFTARYG